MSRIDLPAPPGYSLEDQALTGALAAQAMDLVGQASTPVALSALLTAFINIARRRGCQLEAAHELVAKGLVLVDRLTASADHHRDQAASSAAASDDVKFH